MASLNQGKIIKALEAIISKPDPGTFIYDFLKAYGTSPATLKRLQMGDSQRNVARIAGDTALVQKIYFRKVGRGQSLQQALQAIQALPVIEVSRIRFILVTDFESVLAYDKKVDDQTSFDFAEFPTNYEFFLPLTGLYEKSILYEVHPADIKACEKMGRLYDNIKTLNHFDNSNIHGLNVFLTRLLFCFFAEDTGIFPNENQMTDAIMANTLEDGSDLPDFFAKLFDVLDLPENDPSRKVLPASFQAFPYVNGSLFAEKVAIPTMDKKSRKLLIECGQMAWQEISPVIFGSMFQSVMDKEKRRSIGAHYTSEENILKLVRPLFLDDLHQEFERICGIKAGKARALHDFHAKIASLGFLDPACGCGNFLIVAYRELRELELGILVELARMEKAQANRVVDVTLLTRVSISQFFGIELEEFPVEIARVSLWLMEHVMNLKLGKQFGQVVASIPLKHTPGIVCANALTTPWESVVAADKISYILGNPPFVGYSNMSSVQKAEMALIFGSSAGKLDFVTAWYKKASNFMQGHKAIKTAFVSTNSICQGEQVYTLWSNLLDQGITINFAHQTFQWNNEAKNKAAVYCVIIGFSYVDVNKKYIFQYKHICGQPYQVMCNKINPYLTEGSSIIVKSAENKLSAQIDMYYGNKPTDNGNLILTPDDKSDIISSDARLASYIFEFIGAEEFLHGKQRFCLWLADAPQDILHSQTISNRLESCKLFRQNSSKAATKRCATTPHLFQEFRSATLPQKALVIPSHSSEKRKYIPFGYINEAVVGNSCHMLPNASLYDFGILTSSMHMAWMRTVCGRLKSDYRYSRDLCYNTFPWPSVTDKQKNNITTLAEEVLLARENHPDMTLADLYDPDKMPDDLKASHDALDSAVDSLYRRKPFASDDERLQILFKMYEILVKKNSPKPITLPLLEYDTED